MKTSANGLRVEYEKGDYAHKPLLQVEAEMAADNERKREAEAVNAQDKK